MTDRPPREILLAAFVAGLEGLALLGVAALLAVQTALDQPDSYGRALGGVAITALGAAALFRLGVGLLRIEGWARAPLIVLQLLLLPVGYSLGFQAGRPWYGVPIVLACLAELYLLLTPQARLTFYDR